MPSMLSASGWPESRISRPLWCSAMPTLREMVEKKPLSTDELLNISGVGEKKAARYGNAFLRIIEDAVGSRE